MTPARSTVVASALAALPFVSPAVVAAEGNPTANTASEWLPWLVLGAIALFVVGLVLRMIIASRFPKGYQHWAKARRESFAARNEAWDRDDEAFRK